MAVDSDPIYGQRSTFNQLELLLSSIPRFLLYCLRSNIELLRLTSYAGVLSISSNLTVAGSAFAPLAYE